jgi:hypothetical protein
MNDIVPLRYEWIKQLDRIVQGHLLPHEIGFMFKDADEFVSSAYKSDTLAYLLIKGEEDLE